MRRLNHPAALVSLLRPESPLEAHLLTVPAFCEGLLWGEPRFGHPEGKVALHVREVLDNIDRIRPLDPVGRSQLRLIALTHDTFKYQEDRSRPRDWSKHHATLARNFMESYTSDPVVLDVLETHDDAYYVWLAERKGLPDNYGKTLEGLLNRIDHCLQQYYLFFKCDTQTGDKTQASLKWFEQRIPGIEVVTIRE